MEWWRSVETALSNLGGSASLKRIYDEVRTVRERQNDTLPRSFEAIVRRELEYNSSDSTNWKQRRNLFYSVDGIGAGHWGLRSSLQSAPIAHDLGSVAPERAEVSILRIIRDTVLTKKIKLLHENVCQMCGATIELPNGSRYSEAHHIIPLGRPHNGPDSAENIIVVCLNHHAMLDLGSCNLDASALRTKSGHRISSASVNYHNENIVGQLAR